MLCPFSSLFPAEAGHLQGPVSCWAQLQTPAQGSWRSTGAIAQRLFTPPPSHTPDLPTQSLPFQRTRPGAAFWSCRPRWEHHGLWTRWSVLWHSLPVSTLPLGITGPYVLFKSTLTWTNTTNVCAANIWQGERRSSLSASLHGWVQQGQRWHALAAGSVLFPKINRKTWNPSRPTGRSLLRVCLIHSCKVKATSLPDSSTLIKGLVIPHLPIQVYLYTDLLGYFLHKALNKMPSFFSLLFNRCREPFCQERNKCSTKPISIDNLFLQYSI